MAEYVDKSGVSHFNNLMRELGWVFMGDSREADLKGVDGTYKLGYATVYVQIKSANLVTEFANDSTRKSYRRWHWEIFSKGKTLRIEFYREKNCFLGLVGLDVTEAPYTETNLTIRGEKPKLFIEAKEFEIGLIPGNMVIEHFQEAAPKSHEITLKENSKSMWNKYFDRENIEELLLKEFERQTKNQPSSNVA
jgi:hypothetical protein